MNLLLNPPRSVYIVSKRTLCCYVMIFYTHFKQFIIMEFWTSQN